QKNSGKGSGHKGVLGVARMQSGVSVPDCIRATAALSPTLALSSCRKGGEGLTVPLFMHVPGCAPLPLVGEGLGQRGFASVRLHRGIGFLVVAFDEGAPRLSADR